MTEPLTTALRDGTRALLRPIEPTDRDRLAEGLRRLSPRSQRLRFHAAVSQLTEAQLDYLTQVDQRDHVAWVALDRDHPEQPGIGVARFVRLGDEPTVAEAAITVADDYQGRGAGTLLLGLLAGLALDLGVTTFRNYVMAGNRWMLHVFDELGGIRETEAPGVFRVDLPLPGPGQELPDSPAGRAFQAAARDRLAIDRLAPPLWVRSEPRAGEDAPLGGAVAGDEPSTTEGDDLTAWLGSWDAAARDASPRSDPTTDG